jgi:prephenate dehydratase
MSDPALYYLGPQGSFCEEAAIAFAGRLDLHRDEMVAGPHIAAILEEVASRQGVWGVIPAENSTEGSVNLTWDLLLATEGLTIEGEFYLPVRHHLLVQRGAQLSSIAAVLSHPHALA